MISIFRLTVRFFITLGIAASQFAQAAKPNILLFLSDDLTYHDIGCYGNEEVRTPTIDQMAEDGLRFEYCFNSCLLYTSDAADE